ncbi:MAG: 4-hydroxybutyrate CoA-transferase [Bacteroidetes bacterium]|nr:4-hydroxybutyrate CoA-transferase [Bacteroidota bacterium]
MPRYETPQKAMSAIRSGDRVFIHSVAAAPQMLISAMVEQPLKNVEIVHLHTEGDAPYTKPEYADSFRVNALFIGANTRKATQEGRADYTPVFLSEVPALFRKKILPLDVALVQVSPPDSHGYYSLGVSVDATRAAIESATTVIAQVNSFMPRTHGDAFIHESDIDIAVIHDQPLPEAIPSVVGNAELSIGRFVASLVEDGATLQMGIGAIPDAVLASLDNHKRLGIHTEMFSDGVIPLVEKGVITGEEKKVHPRKITAGFVMGTRRLYDFINDNPSVNMLDIGYINDTAVIRRNPKVTAINSAIEVDITGQVCADSIGKKMYSGVGGQMDFIRGAALSEGGKPIIALPSTTRNGSTRISVFLNEGAGVVSTRAHIHYVVTEYGIAYLYAKSLQVRAQELVNIAHPNHREDLARGIFETRGWRIKI